MRLVKLSTDEFAGEGDLQVYLGEVLPQRNPPGLFRFRGHIAEGALDPGETVLFSYRGRLRFVAQAEAGRMDNIYMPDVDYPHCFIINLETLRRADVPLDKVEHHLQTEAGLSVSLRGQGWTRIPDSERAEQAIDTLILSSQAT